MPNALKKLVSFFPTGQLISITSEAVVISYGSDGIVTVRPDGFCTGHPRTIRRLKMYFTRAEIPFKSLSNNLLVGSY